MNKNTTINFLKPVLDGDTEITEITLREPTIDDISKIGYPFLMLETEDGTAIKPQVQVILKYASTLAGVTPSCLKKLGIKDLMKIQIVVLGFFGDTDEEETPQT